MICLMLHNCGMSQGSTQVSLTQSCVFFHQKRGLSIHFFTACIELIASCWILGLSSPSPQFFLGEVGFFLRCLFLLPIILKVLFVFHTNPEQPFPSFLRPGTRHDFSGGLWAFICIAPQGNNELPSSVICVTVTKEREELIDTYLTRVLLPAPLCSDLSV